MAQLEMTPAEHPKWPQLTDEQRRTLNEVWDETVIAALKRAEQVERDALATLLEAQAMCDRAKAASGLTAFEQTLRMWRYRGLAGWTWPA